MTTVPETNLALTEDEKTILDGIAHGYPLPSQHPARKWEDLPTDEFFAILIPLAKRRMVGVLPSNKLVLLPAGLSALSERRT